MWIEWEDHLFNMDQVKRIYMHQHSEINWSIEIVFEAHDRYISFFESKAEAEKEYEKFKEKLVRMFTYIRSVPF